MKSAKIIIPVLALIGLFASSSFFVIKEGHQAVVTQFGKPVGGPYNKAGLYYKIPFVQDVHMFEKRLLKWDGSPNQIPTRDKKYIWVDTTARWRIVDPLRFLQTVATERGAQSRLDDTIDSVVRDTASSNLLVELVRSKGWKPGMTFNEEEGTETIDKAGSVRAPGFSQKVEMGRNTITRRMLAEARKLTPQYGIELVDVQIKRINYVESVRRQVYQRMISERKRIASQYRSEGEGEKQRILGEMQKELARIRSEAYKQAQTTRGKADAEATTIYGKSFGEDPKFYAMFKTLETYGRVSQGKIDLILSTDGDYMKYLKKANPE